MQTYQWLEARGTALTTQAAAPWTMPSFATVMTGVLPATHRAGKFGAAVVPLADTYPTLAQRLHDAGWDTASTNENPFASSAVGITRGFARVREDIVRFNVLPRGLWPMATLRPGRCDRAGHRAATAGSRQWRVHDARELFASMDRPMFVWMNVLDPHVPIPTQRVLQSSVFRKRCGCRMCRALA